MVNTSKATPSSYFFVAPLAAPPFGSWAGAFLAAPPWPDGWLAPMLPVDLDLLLLVTVGILADGGWLS
jgi:hypothetical protein